MNKKKLLSSTIIFLCLISVIIGFIQINLINTKALSPLGNTNDNFELVSEEFGKDFANFIKDNSSVKVYKENNGEYLVRLNEAGDYRITAQSSFTENLKSIGDEIWGTLNDMKDGINGLLGK